MTAVIRIIVDSRKVTRISEHVHFIVVSITQSLTIGLLIVSWTITVYIANLAVNAITITVTKSVSADFLIQLKCTQHWYGSN